MKQASPCILAVNGGSSSIKFALFRPGVPPACVARGKIEGVGTQKATFTVSAEGQPASPTRSVPASSPTAALQLVIEWVDQNLEADALIAVGHRVVHGGPQLWEPTRLTPEVLEQLRALSPFDPDHLPDELLIIEGFQRRFPALPQLACFDTGFHHHLPRVAQLLPIPRRYQAQGARRYGFHGLSYAYLIQELERLAGPTVANGRVILAHLGSGASLAAVREGRSIDTTMALTPAAGLVMSSRSGDVDPGVFSFLARTDRLTVAQVDAMLSHESGLLGVSGSSGNIKELLSREREDVAAAEAVCLFCYQAKKWLGAYAAALGGLETLVFSGGIGEHSALVRARICEGLGFLGIELDQSPNEIDAEVISAPSSRVTVRVIRTDEESVIAQAVFRALATGAATQGHR